MHVTVHSEANPPTAVKAAPLPQAWVYAPPAALPTLVHLDEHLLVVNKPPGLLSVPGRLPEHHDSALQRLQGLYGPLWVVHRLDMDTSGLIAFARSRETAAHLGRQFEQRRVYKVYEALVWGHPPSNHGVIALPLRLDWPHRPRQLVDAQSGKPSVTVYAQADHPEPQGNGMSRQPPCSWLGSSPPHGTSRLRLTPTTGRSHQLRVHLSAIGLPVLGDRFYGRPEHEEPEVQRLMLHASVLELQHPTVKQQLRLVAAAGF